MLVTAPLTSAQYLAHEYVLDEAAGFKYDLVAFAKDVHAVPFGRPGHWESWQGFWPWQEKLLRGIGDEYRRKEWGRLNPDGTVPRLAPVRRVISSATGTGKTALVLPLILFHAMACFPKMKAICVSPTKDQLKDKLFKAVKVMMEASPLLTRLFRISESGLIERRACPALSNCVFRTSDKQAPLQGMHSHGGMTLVMIDEASGVGEEQWAATAGARREEQSSVILSGNPLTSEGFFHRRHSGDRAKDWNPIFVSQLELPNWDETQHADIIAEAGGIDTDDYRANVLAKPPLKSSGRFLPHIQIEQAMERPLLDGMGRPIVPHDTPLVAGVDLAGEGEAMNCAVFRAGMDMRTVPVEQISGRDLIPEEKVDWMCRIAAEDRPPYGAPVVVFVDATALDGQLRVMLERTPHGYKFRWIRFGDPPKDPRFKAAANNRVAMYQGFRTWLFKGGRIRQSQDLLRTLAEPKAFWKHGKTQITAKEDIAAQAGKSVLDEVDAMLLAAKEPEAGAWGVPVRHEPADPFAVRRGPRRVSWMG